jgi:hypothetical protein
MIKKLSIGFKYYVLAPVFLVEDQQSKSQLSRVQPSQFQNIMSLPLLSIGMHVRAGFVQPHGTMSPCLRIRWLANAIPVAFASTLSVIAQALPVGW